MNEKKETQNSFFRAFLKSSLESVGSNAKINDSNEDELVLWFQDKTHVDTNVDVFLEKKILEKSLVFLSGTPGSGKTQFIKRLRTYLESDDYDLVPIEGDKSGVLKYSKDTDTLVLKHDATQVDHETKNAARELAKLLKDDWDDTNFDKTPKANRYLIGINQGVLMRLFSLPDFKKLYDAYVNDPRSDITVIDLSYRTVIDPQYPNQSFINDFLEKFTEKNYWENPPTPSGGKDYQTCFGCELVKTELCPILENIKQIRKPKIREKIHEIFTLNYFFPGQVITFRDVLAIISKMTVGYHDHYDNSENPCDEIRSISKGKEISDIFNLSRLFFYNSLFSSEDVWESFLQLEVQKTAGKFHGYCGPYFVVNKETGCNIHKFDPAQSSSDYFREIDDKIFNQPKIYLNKLLKYSSILEKRLINEILKHLEIYEEPTGEGSSKDEFDKNINKRNFLLYCFINVFRRRSYFFDDKIKKYGISNYKHATEYCEIIATLKGGNPSKIKPVEGDLLKAIADLSGVRAGAGLLRIKWTPEWQKIETTVEADVGTKILLSDVPGRIKEYEDEINYYPKTFEFKIKSKETKDEIASLPIDIETWEFLKRAHEGHIKGYSGHILPKAIEGFLDSLRARLWNVVKNPSIVIHANSIDAKIKKDGKNITLH